MGTAKAAGQMSILDSFLIEGRDELYVFTPIS
jgi:hypothetical protein